MSLVKIPKKVLHLDAVVAWCGSNSQAWDDRRGRYSHKAAERENQVFHNLKYSLINGYHHPDTGSKLMPTQYLEESLDESLNIVDGNIKGNFIFIQNGYLIYVTSCEDPAYKTMLSEKENILSVLKKKLSRPKQKDLNFLTRVRNFQDEDGIKYYCDQPMVIARNATLSFDVEYVNYRESRASANKKSRIASSSISVGINNLALYENRLSTTYHREVISRQSVIRPNEYEISELIRLLQEDKYLFDGLRHASLDSFPSNANSLYQKIFTGGLKLSSNYVNIFLKSCKENGKSRITVNNNYTEFSVPVILSAIEEDVEQCLRDEYHKTKVNCALLKMTGCVIHTDKGDFDVPINNS